MRATARREKIFSRMVYGALYIIPRMARSIGRFLQACGIVLAPMALFYYFDHARSPHPGGLGTMEWMILAGAVVLFAIGRRLER